MSLKDVLGSEPKWEQVQTGGDGEQAERIEPAVGDVLIGTLTGAFPVTSKFPDPKNPGQKKINTLYKITGIDGKDVVFFGKGNLSYQLKSVADGTLVRLERLPDEESKDGWTVQNWAVFTAAS